MDLTKAIELLELAFLISWPLTEIAQAGEAGFSFAGGKGLFEPSGWSPPPPPKGLN